MLNKIFSFLGFNSNDSYVGLTQLCENPVKHEQNLPKPVKKDLKLSDLMRGN